MADRIIAAARSALQMVGLMFLLTLSVGGITAKPTEWTIFLSGGLWIGLPMVVAALTYGSARDERRGER